MSRMRDADVYRRSFQTLQRMVAFRDQLRTDREVVGPHFSVDVDTTRLHAEQYRKLSQEYVFLTELLATSQCNVFGAIIVKYPGPELGWVLPHGWRDDPKHVLAIQKIHERMPYEEYESKVNNRWAWHVKRINLMLRSGLTLNSIIAFKLTM